MFSLLKKLYIKKIEHVRNDSVFASKLNMNLHLILGLMLDGYRSFFFPLLNIVKLIEKFSKTTGCVLHSYCKVLFVCRRKNFPARRKTEFLLLRIFI
jgi:hypothetical protein